MSTAAKTAQIITPDAYPMLISRQNAARAMSTLRSPETAARAQTAVATALPPMRAAILQYVAEMEMGGMAEDQMFTRVHEIRNFADTAGMGSTGRIADVLCRYMDDMLRVTKPVDPAIVTLHVSAIARAARAEKDDIRMGNIVATELAALVNRKLAEAGVHHPGS